METIKAYAKVNINLKVYKKKIFKKRHKINSLFYKVRDLYDVIQIKEIDIPKDNVICSLELKNTNAFLYVLDVLRSKNIIKGFYEIKILKNIPFYSGLGGLSSCIAEVAKYFLKLENNNKVINKVINKICKYVGYDCYFFFSNFDCALVTSYGEKIIKADTKISISKNDLLFSNVQCSTKKVFYSYNKNKFWINNDEINMLKPAILNEYPELNIANNINNYFFTGSGSTMINKNVLK